MFINKMFQTGAVWWYDYLWMVCIMYYL